MGSEGFRPCCCTVSLRGCIYGVIITVDNDDDACYVRNVDDNNKDDHDDKYDNNDDHYEKNIDGNHSDVDRNDKSKSNSSNIDYDSNDKR